jgi:hypothetical protein
LISIINEGMVFDPLGDGPMQGAGLITWRKLPLYLGWLAGISRIGPIDVPATLKLKV